MLENSNMKQSLTMWTTVPRHFRVLSTRANRSWSPASSSLRFTRAFSASTCKHVKVPFWHYTILDGKRPAYLLFFLTFNLKVTSKPLPRFNGAKNHSTEPCSRIRWWWDDQDHMEEDSRGGQLHDIYHLGPSLIISYSSFYRTLNLISSILTWDWSTEIRYELNTLHFPLYHTAL